MIIHITEGSIVVPVSGQFFNLAHGCLSNLSGDHSASQAHGHHVDVADALLQLNHNHQSLNPDPMYESDQQQQQRLRQLQRTERASTRIQAANTTQSSSGFYNSQQQPQPPDSSTLRKRNTPPEPINPPQPPKKAKKATATTGATAAVLPSKRGFSKKKRDEAAAVHATNGMWNLHCFQDLLTCSSLCPNRNIC